MTTEDDFSPAAVKAALVDTFTVGYRRLVGEGRGVEFARPALDLSRYLRRLPDDDDRLVQLAKLVPNTAALLALIPEDEPPTLPNGICEPFLSHLIHRARVSRNLPIEPMKLYVHLPVRVAATIVRSGRFEPWQMLTTADGQVDCCVFWDVPPRGWETTRTTEVTYTVDDQPDDGGAAQIRGEVGGGMTMVTDGDITLSIDVPHDLAAPWEAREDPPAGWRFREFWLPADLVNEHMDTLAAHVFDSGDPVPLEALRAEHGVIITDRFTAFGGLENPAPVGAICVCGERWRWSPDSGTDPRVELPPWLETHSA